MYEFSELLLGVYWWPLLCAPSLNVEEITTVTLQTLKCIVS